MRVRAGLSVGEIRFDPSPLSWPGLIFAGLGAVVLIWPYLAFGGALTFPDSQSYVAQGNAILAWAFGAIDAAVDVPAGVFAGSGAGGGAKPETSAELAKASFAQASAMADELRSLPYALFASITRSTPLGTLGTALAQAFLSLFALWPLVASVGASRPRLAFAALLALAAASALPLYATYMMPDVFGGIVVVYYLLLLGPIRSLGLWARATLAGVGAFAIASHYGNVPLAFGLAAITTSLLALRRSLDRMSLVLAVGPVLAVVAFNAALGLTLTSGKSASLTPLRLPLVLARSIEDGPARWYLTDACERKDYAICEVFPEGIPNNIHSVMWSEGGLSSIARERLNRVRAEEVAILWQSFLAYPVEQTWSLAGNTVRQAFSVGGGGLRFPAGGDARDDGDAKPWFRAVLGPVLLSGYIAGIIVSLLSLHPRRWVIGPNPDIAFTLLAALGGNALIFGGLSAPVDRYQTRLAWVVVAVGFLIATRLRSERASAEKDGYAEA